MIRIQYDEMRDVLTKLFIRHQFSSEKANLLAKTFSESTLYGVNSHGINRVGQFMEYLEKGLILKQAEAERVEVFGSIERWDGRLGPGIINAAKATQRAIELAQENGLGLVALRNTNHWMRGGTYGRMAADAGCMAILFTNTIANMPPWGAKESRIGNNPLIVAIPRAKGHILLDMAISQFSFGKMYNHKLAEEKLPYPGGWDNADNLTDDPAAILDSMRALPIGYWKGSALSMILDLLATLLSAGNSTYRVSQSQYESGISQIFLCINPATFGDGAIQETLTEEVLEYTRQAERINPADRIYYPGERSALAREKNLKAGMLVDESVWQTVLSL